MSVTGDRVLVESVVSAEASLEELDRNRRLRLRAAFEAHGHQLAIRREIEQLLTVCTPYGSHPAGVRRLTTVAKGRKGSDIDFPLTGFVAGVGDPPTVGRNVRLVGFEIGMEG